MRWGQELTVAEVAVLRAERGRFAERTLRTDEAHLRRHILPRFGDVPIGRLSRLDLQQPLSGGKSLGTPERMARRRHPLREDCQILPRYPLPRSRR